MVQVKRVYRYFPPFIEIVSTVIFITSRVQGFAIGEIEPDHWLQLVTFGSYQSPKTTICSIYLQQNHERILVINGSKFSGGNHL